MQGENQHPLDIDTITDVAVLKSEVSAIKAAQKECLTKQEFAPYRLLLITVCGTGVTVIVTAILSMLMHK